MKRFSLMLCCIVLLNFLLYGTTYVAAATVSTNVLDEISAMVQEHRDRAKIPAVSVAIVQGEEVTYLSFGDELIDQEALYQIGSTTKAFTALGILWLEDEGLISLDDPVSMYLPWFNMTYGGVTVPANDITIANLLYQTSGFTNNEIKYPKPQAGMTLEAYVQTLSGRELVFYPSTQFSYANANYSTLGIIIETVTGQSYQDFMSETILTPLGLHNTYVDPSLAIQERFVVPGSRLAFLQTHPYPLPIHTASVPSGYILSNAGDMGRWMQIQLGAVELSPQMARIVEKSQQPNESHLVNENTGYAAGWFVENTGTIYHTGLTPNYSAKVVFNPTINVAVCVLTNTNASSNTNMMADNILAMLEGKPPTVYKADIWVVIDTIFTMLTCACVILIAFVIATLFRLKVQCLKEIRVKTRAGKQTLLLMSIPTILLMLALAMLVVFPLVFGLGWQALNVWASYSLYTGVASFTLLSVLLLVAAYIFNIYPKQRGDV